MSNTIVDYLRAKATVEAFEQEQFQAVVQPLTCLTCQERTVQPDFQTGGKPDPSRIDECLCWDGGVVAKLSPGWGSKHDLSSFYIAICDECLTRLSQEGKLLNTQEVKDQWKDRFKAIQNPQGRVYAKPIPEYADLMTAEDWEEAVREGWFISDDGSGYWVREDRESRDEVFSTPRQDATHVAWYNK